MFGDEKNLKDTTEDSMKDTSDKSNYLAVITGSSLLSYTKTNKLITALFMVTDMIDKEEPLRNKLRILSSEVLSDVHTNPSLALGKIHDIVSFLEISFTINLISEMNSNILKKEFVELYKSIDRYVNSKNKHLSMEDFLSDREDAQLQEKVPSFITYPSHPVATSPLHNGQPRTRIGVQNGATLMKALSDKTNSIPKPIIPNNYTNSFDILKRQRREDIVKILKDKTTGATIKDIQIVIKDKAIASLISHGEKTLQRELLAMVKDGVLNRVGEKRWSKYFVKK